jgi:transcriptional regulator with XRE-family HTH domain
MRKPKSDAMRSFDIEVGKRLVSVRERLDLRVKDVASAGGISPAALYFYETGKTTCPPMVLARIAAGLGISITVLIPKTINSSFPGDRREKSLNRV